MLYSKLIKTCSVITATILFGTQTSFASTLNMKVFEESQSGKAALIGDYQKAIDIAKPRLASVSSYRRMLAATHLCVAYTKTAKLAEAHTYCEMAIENSMFIDKKNKPGEFLGDNGQNLTLLEIAENNYKVLKSLKVKSELSAKN